MFNSSQPLPPIVLLFAIYLLFGASFVLGMISATSLFFMANL